MQVPAARQLRQGASPTCARWPTRSARAGRDVPFLNWRYILFNWNDRDEEMDRARGDGGRDRRRSAVLGDHRSPRGLRSRAASRRARRLRAHPARDLGQQRARQRHSRRHAARADRRARRCCPGCRCIAPGAARPVHVQHARPQPVDPPVPRAGHATAAGSCASARSCAEPTARCINRDYARAWLPATSRPGGSGRRRDRSRRRPNSRAATRSSSTWSAKASTGSSSAARRRRHAPSSSAETAAAHASRR